MSDSEPLVSAEVSMRGLSYMPLHIERLQKSKAWLVCKRRPDLAFYILNLWMRAWTEEPAGSIEDDDDVLADAAMCPPDQWPNIKADVMRGWVLCKDGRWYHPTVCEIALETWSKRSAAERKRSEDRQRKRAVRNASDGKTPQQPEVSNGHGCGNTDLSDGQTKNSNGHASDKDLFPPENALKRREGKSKGRDSSSEAKASGASAPPQPLTLEVEFFRKGRALLGESSGGLLAKAKSQRGLDKAMGLLADAESKENPKEWFAKAVKLGTEPGSSTDGMGLGYVPLQFAE